MSAIVLWKRRGKKIRLGFDLRTTAGPEDEVMKLKSVLGFAMAAVAAWGAFAEARQTSVTNLKVTSIAPFGLAIDYTVSEATADDAGRPLEISFVADGVTNIAQTLVGETNCVNGAHRVYWNMAADGITADVTNGVVSVAYAPTYCVVDLETHEVEYLQKQVAPDYFNTDEYKTTKIVLKRVPAGSFILGSDQTNEAHRVTLTKPFYMGLFEVTQKQWELVTGASKNWYSRYGIGDALPAYYVSYNNIRGSSNGANWPTTNAVDDSSFLGKLRTMAGGSFDLPTEAQWEYVCRAGTTNAYGYGNSADGAFMWYSGNAGSSSSGTYGAKEVGTRKPNPWGFYDMHGNVAEWCLDWYDSWSSSLTYGMDPVGPDNSDDDYSYHVIRGGSWNDSAVYCVSSYRSGDYASDYSYDLGFRLVQTLTPEVMAQEIAANAASVSNISVSVVADGRMLLEGEHEISYAPHGTTNVVVAIDGEEVVNAATAGTYQWLADEVKSYTVTYSVGDVVMSATYVVHAAPPTVSGLKVTPIRPWGVRLDYDLTDVTDDNETFFPYVTMSVGGNTNVASSLQGDWECTEGAHRVYWNMAQDGISVDSLTNVTFAVCYRDPCLAPYCVVDLTAESDGTTPVVQYVFEPVPDLFTDEAYKTTKLVLKRVEAGSFIMGSDQTNEAHRVTLTKPFYMGLYEVTQKQWELLMGTSSRWDSYYGFGDSFPAYHVSYDDIRGSSNGAKWPVTNTVDEESFLGKLRAKSGIDFDLPTEAQWEYACRAGTTTKYSHGDNADDAYMYLYSSRRSYNKEVGQKLPNPWGFYDMHGNMAEWCLDLYSNSPSYGTDPVGPTKSTWGSDNRVIRGGDGDNTTDYWCTSSCRDEQYSWHSFFSRLGFRLTCPISENEPLLLSGVGGATATMQISGIVATRQSIAGTAREIDCLPEEDVNAVVCANDFELAQSDEATSFAWQPRTTGSFVLQHAVGDIVLSATYRVTSHSFWYQPSANAPMAYDADIKLGATSETFETADADYVVIETRGVGSWTAATSVSWLTLSATNGAAGSSLVCVVDANTNNAAESRMGYVYVAGHVFTVTQAGRGAAVSPLDVAMEQTGGPATVHVAPGCDPFTHDAASAAETTWRVRPNVDWIHVSCANGVGEGSVTLDVAPWFGLGDRMGTVLVAGQTVTVVQKGEEMSLSSEACEVVADGGTVTLEATVPSGVVWSVRGVPPWIAVADAANRVGAGSVVLVVAPNDNVLARTATLTIAGRPFVVNQLASQIALTGVTEFLFGRAGGSRTVDVDVASDDITWSATSSATNWLIPFNGSNRTGSGTLLFYVGALAGDTVRREATLTIGNQTVRVVQVAQDITCEPGRHYADGGVAGEGQVVTLEATPPDGFEFVRWEGPDGESRTENPTVVSVSDAEAYEPIFAARRPVITNVVQSAEGVAVAWSNLAWAAEYRVWRGATTNVAEATRLATVARGTALAYRDSTGTTGQGYWYWIEAVDDEEETSVVEDTWSLPVEGAKGEARVVQSLIVYENLKGAANGNPTWYQEGTAMELAAPGEIECWEFAGWTPSAITADMTGAQTVTANWTLKSVAAPTSTPGNGASFSGDSCEIALACALDGARIYFTTNGVTPRTTEKFLYTTPFAIDKTTTVKAIAVYGELKSALMTSVITQKEASEADVAYEAWVDSVTGTDTAKRQAIRDAQYSRLAFALDLGYDAAVLLAPKEGDLKITTFAGGAVASDADGEGSTSLPSGAMSDGVWTLTVALDGVSVGANATAENLSEAFVVEGAATLDDAAFSSAVVTATFAPTGDGQVKITARPTDASAPSFFIRVRLRELSK